MIAFLVAFGLVGILVVCSVGVSLYLFQCGAVGRSFRRTRRFERVVVEAATDEESDDVFMVEPDVDMTSRFTRNSVFFLFGGLLVIGILLTTIFNAIIH